ncbi:MAG: carboxypeptidase regulatory-like domain-containing protein, partial [Planctomycetes bacterium]|nr:carboxypeptidase regulatory-like domain-containing protein [Planctomycetota bacterium]
VSKMPVLTGQFVNAKGEPVGSARITALSGFLLGPTTVNLDGTFVIQMTYASASLGFYATNADGTLGALVQMDMEKAKKEPLRIILAEMGEVKGKVEDDAGQPVNGARLWMRRDMTHGTIPAGVTDAEGRFVVRLPPGAWRAWATGPQGFSTPGQSPASEFQLAAGKPVEGLRFVLSRPRREAR